jgi:hypothetical protein
VDGVAAIDLRLGFPVDDQIAAVPHDDELLALPSASGRMAIHGQRCGHLHRRVHTVREKRGVDMASPGLAPELEQERTSEVSLCRQPNQ